MSGAGECRADFAGEERAFRVRLREIRQIEDKCKTGIGEVLRRLARATFVLKEVGGLQALAAGIEIHADDVREPIYQGLIAAGMPSGEATALVRAEIDDRGVPGLLDNAGSALLVLFATSRTPRKPDAGEPEAGTTPATPPNPSTSPKSTAQAKRSASRRARSTN